MSGWTGGATIALILASVGAPINVRICVLPLWRWMPIGVGAFGRMVDRGTAAGPGVWVVGLLSCVILGGLSMAPCGIWSMGLWLRSTS